MAKPSSAQNYTEQMQRIMHEYMAINGRAPASTRHVAAWAIETGRWRPQPHSLIARCAEELSRALREEYITDPQGRMVRAMHAAKYDKDGEQFVLWADIRTANRDHMATAFQQRRQQIVGDCRQLKTDVDSYNENAKPGRPIQMVFNFEDDLAELEALHTRRAA